MLRTDEASFRCNFRYIMQKKKICVVVNSRANYGRIKSFLKAVQVHPDLKLQLIVGASALLYRFGSAIDIIREDGFDPVSVVYSIVEGETPSTMAKSTGMGILELAQTIAPGCEIKHIGIRSGEKIHEALISTDEARNAIDLGDKFVIEPSTAMFPENSWRNEGDKLPDGFQYTSDTNPKQLAGKELMALIGEPVAGEPYVGIA